MKIISVNIGKIQTYPWRNGTQSALHKFPVQDPISINKLGLEGDEQADLNNHGGTDKAVFILPTGHYQRFKIQQPFGFLGENLTIEGLDETQVCLGDRFQIGDLLLEVTQPRSPCWKLGQHASIQDNWTLSSFLQAYSKEGYIGFYCRVLTSGTVQAGQSLTWLPYKDSDKTLTIQSLFLAKQHYQTEQDQQQLQTAVKHPALSNAWKSSIQSLLAMPLKTS